MKYKFERINKLLINEIMKIITNREVRDPRIPDFLTITKLKISRDLHYCHCFISIDDNENKKKAAIAGLNNAAGFFQKLLAERINLQYTPKIEFRYDENEDKAKKIDQLLDQISKENSSSD